MDHPGTSPACTSPSGSSPMAAGSCALSGSGHVRQLRLRLVTDDIVVFFLFLALVADEWTFCFFALQPPEVRRAGRGEQGEDKVSTFQTRKGIAKSGAQFIQFSFTKKESCVTED